MEQIRMQRHPSNPASWRIGEGSTYVQRGHGNALVDAAIAAMEAQGAVAGYVTVVVTHGEENDGTAR